MKRFLSMVLTLVMVLSLIPAVFATGEATEKTYVLDSNSGNGISGSKVLSEVKAYGDGTKTWGWKHFGYLESFEEVSDTKGKYLGYVSTEANGLLFYVKANNMTTLTFALSLQAPSVSGFYIPSTYWYNRTKGANFDAYISKCDEDNRDVASHTQPNYLLFSAQGSSVGYEKSTATADKAIYTTSDDDIIAAYKLYEAGYSFYDIRLTPISNPTMTISVDEDELTASVTVSGKASFYNQTNSAYDDPIDVSMPVSNNFITYSSDNTTVAVIDSKTGVITPGGGYGTAIISAETSDGVKCTVEYEVEEPAPEKTDLEIAFELDGEEDITGSYTAPSVTGTDFAGNVFSAEDNTDGTFTLTAPEKNSAENPFLYWAKGMQTKKRIISFDRVIDNYVPAENGRNYLIAVYEGDIENAPEEYYNQNGQLIGTGTRPALPSMAGYGAADEWVQCGNTNIWVAKYGEKTQPDNVTVTVDGEQRTVPYGTDVPCEADGDNFKCWTKQGENEEKAEIVSIDENYTFKAWENCTVTAVYEENTKPASAMKIFIDSFTAGNETGIMAEFIGITGAVEKGIMWNDVKIPMTNPGNQFTVIADKNGTYKGYAILENGSGYTLITDGSITISDIAE